MARPPAAPPERHVRRLVGLRGAAARLGGARLCFGKPVRAGEVTVVPVATVHGAGGFGFGTASEDTGDGGGGGGWVDARPLGFIELRPDGARFEAIPDPEARVRAARSALTTLAGAAFTVARIRALRRGRALPGSRVRRALGR